LQAASDYAALRDAIREGAGRSYYPLALLLLAPAEARAQHHRAPEMQPSAAASGRHKRVEVVADLFNVGARRAALMVSVAHAHERIAEPVQRRNHLARKFEADERLLGCTQASANVVNHADRSVLVVRDAQRLMR
jgi:hypothetical protein